MAKKRYAHVVVCIDGGVASVELEGNVEAVILDFDELNETPQLAQTMIDDCPNFARLFPEIWDELKAIVERHG